MADDASTTAPDLTALAVQLLSAYVANNKVEHGDLAGLIQSTRSALGAPEPAPAEPVAAPEPQPVFKRATSINKSLANPDQIISMIDGRPYKTLTRHLKKHGLTPAEYRARYKLPADYPIIAPGYSEQRRQVARDLGLGGRKRAAATPPAETAPEADGAVGATEPASAASAPVPPTRKPRARRTEGTGNSDAPATEAKPAPRSLRGAVAGSGGETDVGAGTEQGTGKSRRGRRRTEPSTPA